MSGNKKLQVAGKLLNSMSGKEGRFL